MTYHGCNDPEGCEFGRMCGFCRRQSMQIQEARGTPVVRAAPEP